MSAALEMRAAAAEALLEELKEENERLRVENAHLQEQLNEKGAATPTGTPTGRFKPKPGEMIPLEKYQARMLKLFDEMTAPPFKETWDIAYGEQHFRTRIDRSPPKLANFDVKIMQDHMRGGFDVRVKLGDRNQMFTLDEGLARAIRNIDSRAMGALMEMSRHCANKFAEHFEPINPMSKQLRDELAENIRDRVVRQLRGR